MPRLRYLHVQQKGRHERSAQLRAISQKHRREWSSGGQQGAQPLQQL